MKRYKESAVIDQKINELVVRFPIEDYPLAWLEFCRTVGTTLEIIAEVAKKKLRKEA